MPFKTHDTGEQPCAHIDGQTARFLIDYFVPATQQISAENYRKHNRAFKLARIKRGYFNQTEGAGRFACPNCSKCFSAAVKVNDHKPNKGQKKTLKRNEDVTFSVVEPYATRELYDLLMSYISQRHPDSNMMDLSFEQFREKTLAHSHMALLKIGQKIVGCSWIDADNQIIVGDYCFYDTQESQERRLGSLMDLKLLEYADIKQIPILTFGAINDESPKLKHKGAYKGTYIFTDGQWTPYQRPQEP